MPLKDGDNLLVDFDDGDAAEVPIHKIRMLPDHFANLAELNDVKEASTDPSNTPTGQARARCSSSATLVSRRHRVDTARRRRMSESGLRRKGLEENPTVTGERTPFKVESRGVRGLPRTEQSSTVVWKSRGKQRRKFRGWPCYRSLRRNVDGLVISLGDTIRFRTDKGPAYLGDVKLICAPPDNSRTPRVYATWFYYPAETGEAGKLACRYEGAVFATDHVDSNDATCIIGHVSVARSLAEYRSANAELATNEAQGGGDGVGDSREIGFRYFVVGNYAPRRRKVISWDPDVREELHLSEGVQ